MNAIEGGPPALTAEYTSSEAILVAEDLAGQLLADLPVDEEGRTDIVSRTWKTETCRSGWSDSRSWDGFVTVSVTYGFAVDRDDQAKRIEYAQLIFEELEDAGLEPVQNPQGDSGIGVSVERDDGLSIVYSPYYDHLSIGTDCVVQDQDPVYVPPHVRIAPGEDNQDLARWPESY